MAHDYLISYSELGTKSHQTRVRMERILLNNIKNVLDGEFVYKKIKNRIIITTYDDKAEEKLKKVFGIAYFSKIRLILTFKDLDYLSDVISNMYKNIRGTFKVKVRRNGNHIFTSIDAQRIIGSKIDGKVDLKNPDIIIYVEIRDDKAIIYDNFTRGPGGLPIGAEDKVLMMFSGGIDSPVAAWMIMSRGCPMDFLYINQGDERQLKAVKDVYNKLMEWTSGVDMKFYVCEDGKYIAENIIRKVHPKYRQVILKKAFYERAIDYAKKSGAKAIVTGESIGQVSTQTVANIRAIQNGFDFLFLRPLIGFDKEKIIELAKFIGTYELSNKVGELCNISAGRVVTHSNIERVEREYSKLKINDVNSETFNEGIIVDVDNIPTNLDPNKKYIIECDSGIRAIRKAAELRKKGFKVVGRRRSQ